MKVRIALLVAVTVSAVACDRQPSDRAGKSGEADAARAEQARFSSSKLGFSVEFPFSLQPTIDDLGAEQTAIGPVRKISHWTSRGDVAFDVTVLEYPEGKLSPDIDGLLRADRNAALAQEGAKMVREWTLRIPVRGGGTTKSLATEIELSNGVRAYRAVCFWGARQYSLSGAGPKTEQVAMRQSFNRFVRSFRLE